MVQFLRRFMGALALDAGAFEDIEATPAADFQSMAVVAMACAAGGIGAIGMGVSGPAGFAVATVLVLTAWLVWVGLIATVGTKVLAEQQTHSDVHELLRVLGFAAAPGVFLVFAAMRTVAPLMIVLVAVWMIAAAVVAIRQALDYRTTGRAVAVCAIAFLVSAGALAAVALMMSTPVN